MLGGALFHAQPGVGVATVGLRPGGVHLPPGRQCLALDGGVVQVGVQLGEGGAIDGAARAGQQVAQLRGDGLWRQVEHAALVVKAQRGVALLAGEAVHLDHGIALVLKLVGPPGDAADALGNDAQLQHAVVGVAGGAAVEAGSALVEQSQVFFQHGAHAVRPKAVAGRVDGGREVGDAGAEGDVGRTPGVGGVVGEEGLGK